jgi:hypothetical protein
MAINAAAHIFCLIFVLLAGCTPTGTWERSGGDKQSLDLDSRECEFIANRVATQQSEKGQTADPGIFRKTYSECLVSMGWHEKTAAIDSEKEGYQDPVQQLAEAINPTTIRGFGQTITVPDNFTLLTNKRMQSGPTIIEQFFWKGKDGSFINILFQKNLAATFKQIPYPVAKPNQLYTSGQGDKARERLQWATFFVQKGSNWVMSTGAYYYVNSKERIIIVITKPLARPSGTVAEKAVLARNQYLQMEEFSVQWQRWLDLQFPAGPGILTQFKKLFNFGL